MAGRGNESAGDAGGAHLSDAFARTETTLVGTLRPRPRWLLALGLRRPLLALGGHRRARGVFLVRALVLAVVLLVLRPKGG